jgi:hypothetical protein
MVISYCCDVMKNRTPLSLFDNGVDGANAVTGDGRGKTPPPAGGASFAKEAGGNVSKPCAISLEGGSAELGVFLRRGCAVVQIPNCASLKISRPPAAEKITRPSAVKIRRFKDIKISD